MNLNLSDVAQTRMRIVSGEVSNAQMERLNGSFIGVMLKPIVFKTISEDLIKKMEGVVQVCEVEAYKALVSFESKEKMKGILAKGKIV